MMEIVFLLFSAADMVRVTGLCPGDLVAHHSECIHMAGENRSDDRTRVSIRQHVLLTISYFPVWKCVFEICLCPALF
eukprot:COSAG02_NODE_7741_length_2866_cov_1.542630_4_plen_77_part_00